MDRNDLQRKSGQKAQEQWRKVAPKRQRDWLYPQQMPRRLPDPIVSKPPPVEMITLEDESNFFYSIREKLKTPVVEQGGCVACWALSGGHLVENCAIYQNGVAENVKDTKLSAQSLINDLPANFDARHLDNWNDIDDCYECSLEDALHMIKHRGIALDAHAPPFTGIYTGYKGYKPAGTIENYFIVDVDRPDVEIASLMKQYGFLVGTFSCGFNYTDYKAGEIYHGQPRDQKLPKPYNHCVLVTGIGHKEEIDANNEVDSTSYLEIQDTAGPEFGDDGFLLVNKKLFINLWGVEGARIHNPEEIRDPNAKDKAVITSWI